MPDNTAAILELKEQIESTEDAERLHDLLEALGKEQLSLDSLKSTKIGKTVGSSRLRKHANDKVAGSATKLLKTWKKMAKDGGASTSRAGGDSPRAPAADTAPSPTGNKTRDTVRNKFTPLLGNKGGVAAQVEQAMYDKFPLDDTLNGKTFRTEGGLGASQANKHNEQNKKDYLAKFRQLLLNLKKNKTLVNNVANGSVKASALVQMSAKELATEEQQKKAAMAKQASFDASDSGWQDRNRVKLALECGIDPDATGVSICEGPLACGSFNTTVTQQLQTRGADEPMTVFFKCNDCKGTWKDDGSNG
jgi:transcription elongation factor S-II